MKEFAFESQEVAEIFASYPERLRPKLISLRRLIFDVASKTEEVGELNEVLRWGQPSYLTLKPKTGTTIRIDQILSAPGHYGMYFHCQTSLLETFRRLYPHEFTYESNRAIIFDEHDIIPIKKLRHNIRLALTYHLDKKRNGSRR